MTELETYTFERSLGVVDELREAVIELREAYELQRNDDGTVN